MDKNLQNISIPIQGLHCASCVSAVEKSIKSLDGVQTVSVNLSSEKSFVVFDSNKVKLSDLNNAIEKAGFKPLIIEDELNNNTSNKSSGIHLKWAEFFISTVFCIPLLYIAMAPMISIISLPFPKFLNPMSYPLLYALVEFFLLVPILIAGRRFYINGVKSLITRSLNMDTLIMTGTLSAILYSIYSTIQIITNHTHFVNYLYFETAGVILTLIMLGKSLESSSRNKTSQAIKKLLNLSPKKALIVVNGKEIEITVKDIKKGDIVLVKPGASIPIDGVVTEGTTSVDESMITGESIPVEKNIGDKVIGATINKNGTILFKVEKTGMETALAQIIKLIEEAQSSKAPIAKIADIVSGYFVPVIIAIALLSSIGWIIAGENLIFAMKIFTSVLVIACPCALGLATPTALIVGTGRGAQNGILIKSGEALESAHKITTVVFDKTGTLTNGKPVVTDVLSYNGMSESELISIAAGIEKKSEHPLAEAILKEASLRAIEPGIVTSFNAVPGNGVVGIIQNSEILAGKFKFIEENCLEITDKNKIISAINALENQGKITICLAIDKVFAGILACMDTLKPDAQKSIAILKRRGIETIMLTGDNIRTAQSIADQAGINKVIAEVLPDEKAGKIKELMNSGQKVAMVGDGINDAPALTTANLGIAIGSGTDVAIESADIVLMHSDIMDVASALELSRITIKNIKQNLFWAFGYNVILIPVAAGILHIFGGPLLNPMFAAAAMSMSSVSVVLNALRLRNIKIIL